MNLNLTLLIIEDNPIDTIIVRHLLKTVSPNLEICGEAIGVEQAITLIETLQPNIILADIELADGSAFEILKKLHEKKVPFGEIIFMSSTERYDYAIKAIEYACLALIQKPLSENVLREALEKAYNQQTNHVQIETLLAHHQKKSNKLVVPIAQHGKEIIDSETINYFEATGQCTIIHFIDGTRLTAFRILGHFKKLLVDDSNFFLVHHSYLVNVNQVKKFHHKTNQVTMKNNISIEASRRYGSNFKDYWNESGKLAKSKQILSDNYLAQ
jgi:two-component system, LytTR family, response regulator